MRSLPIPAGIRSSVRYAGFDLHLAEIYLDALLLCAALAFRLHCREHFVHEHFGHLLTHQLYVLTGPDRYLQSGFYAVILL